MLAGCEVCGGSRTRGCRHRSEGDATRADHGARGLSGRSEGMIRIANGQGFWGDWLEAPVRLVDEGPIDFLVLDYLAEITMSILQKQKQEDPNLGYARDFPPLIGRLAAKLKDRN